MGIVTVWDPRDGYWTRYSYGQPSDASAGRSKKKWQDDLSAFQFDLQVHTRDREKWQKKGDAFVQQWDILHKLHERVLENCMAN